MMYTHLFVVAAVPLLLATSAFASGGLIVQDPELDSLKVAVRWPNADQAAIVALTGRFIAGGRDQEAFAYFQERAKSAPEQPVYGALEGLFQARVASSVWLLRRVSWVEDAIGKLDRAVARDPGLSRFFRGLVLAELPSRFDKAGAAIADLEWVLKNQEHFPPGLRRAVYRGLAKAHTTLGHEHEAREALERTGYASLDDSQPLFLTDGWVTAQDGYHFRQARILEAAPGVRVAQGFDFGDIGFVSTAEGLVAIDAGTTPAHARAALSALEVPLVPATGGVLKPPPGPLAAERIARVILTHAHWDHIGGLAAFQGPGVQTIAQANFATEQQGVNETGIPFRYFFGGQAQTRLHVVPDKLVAKPETLTVGGVEFRLYPIHGGETNDGLLVYLPKSGVLFVGDAFMPYLGAPFLAEGSPEGLFDTIAVIRSLNPRILVHGHVPLTDLYTVAALPGFSDALRDLQRRVLQNIQEGRTLADTVAQQILPDGLRENPAAVMPYLVMRDNFVKRMYHRHTGYWKADGEGMEVVGARQWAAALNILAGGKEGEFARSAATLITQGDYALALKLSDAGLVNYPASPRLAKLRRRALDGLRATYQQLNPFKFIIYSEWAQADLPPVE
jgi:glyoxylase-like metal-dependent hydrolase (beta-lactamase superfamily II)